MEQIKILLACGSGASSGFMASNMRKAAKKQGLDADIKARSDSEIDDFLADIDCLMLGPHLKYMENDIKEKAKPYHVPVSCISQEAYGRLNGEKALQEALDLIENNK